MTRADRLLDRDFARANTKSLRDLAGPALREVVDDCLRVFERCSASARGKDENLGVLFPFLHLAEMLDAAEVQLDASVVAPAMITLRSGFESFLTVLYVTEIDIANRGAAWVVAEIHRRLRALERWDPATIPGRQFRKDMAADVDGRHVTLPDVPGLEADRDGYLTLLKERHLAAASAEYDRTKALIKKHPKFHQLWGGPANVEQLARHLGRAGQYQILYRHWSGTAHGEELGRQLRDGGGVPVISVLRDPSEINTAYGLAISFGLKGAQAVLRCYRPAELDGKPRTEWYRKMVRPAYQAVTPKPDSTNQ